MYRGSCRSQGADLGGFIKRRVFVRIYLLSNAPKCLGHATLQNRQLFTFANMHLALHLLATAITVAAAPSVYLAGDSTMVATGNNDGTEGWGALLPNYISLAVVNDAVAGRSARSFTREGRFTTMAASVKSGDYVVIEFGHNDGGSLTPTDNGRTDCTPVNGDYATTCSTTYG